MSNAGQIVLDIVGAVVGYVIGGPQGALYGFALASGAGQVLFPTQLPPVTGPRISDHGTTTSTMGDPVIIGYGTFPSTGTVNFLDALVEHSTTTTQGGKGGPTQTSTTYNYTQSIGIGLCETTSMDGDNVPITNILRVWENGELVYDIRPRQVGEPYADYTKRVAYSIKYAGTFVLYFGTEDQLPDPTIELQQGANAPFWRGLAYIVYPDRALRTDQGLRHPSFKFEVLKAAAVEPQVSYPTFLDGLHHSSLHPDVLAVDTTNGRYYIQNLDPTYPAVLGFDLIDNTQFVQADPGPDLMNAHGLGVTFDGFVVVGGAAMVAKLDPLTLAIAVTPIPIDNEDWEQYATTTLIQNGVTFYLMQFVGILGGVTTLVTGSTVSNDFSIIRDGSALTTQYSFTDPVIAAGVLGQGVFWVVSRSGSNALFSRINVFYDPLLGVLYTTKSTIGLFVPADLDATWSTVSLVGDILFDPSDGHIIFRVNGDGVFTSSRIVKISPDGAIDWVTTIPFSPSTSYGVNQSVISNNTLWLVDNIANLYESINTTTGVASAVDVAGIGVSSQDGASTTIGGFNGGAILAHYTSVPVGHSSAGWLLVLPSAAVPGKVLISAIVADLCKRSTLDHDVSAMGTETVDGFSIASTPMTARDAIVPLRSVGFFDSCETGDTMRFVRRGRAPAMTLIATDMGAYETGTSQDPPPANSVSTSMESDLPFKIRMSYASPSRDYQPGQQLSIPRFDTRSAQIVDVQLGGICIGDDQAAQATEILWNDSWASDHSYTFAVDQSKAALEPTDVVLVPMLNTLVRVRIASIDDASQILRTITAISDDDGSYVSSAIAAPVPYVTTMRFYAASDLILIDSPMLLDSNDTGRVSAPLYIAVYPDNKDTWAGAAVLESNDAGATYTGVASATMPPAVGQAMSAMGPVDNAFLTDTTNSVTVKVIAGAIPSSVTTLELLNGANAAVLIDADGGVEVFQFRDVTMIDVDTVTLSYLIRGRRGTDTMTGNHAIGSRFIALGVAGTIQKTNVALADVSAALDWKAVGVNDSIAAVPTVPFATTGRSLMPYAPVHVRVNVSGSDLAISATRRARIGAAQWLDGETNALPLAEDSEAYSLDIYSGSDVIRTINATGFPIIYAAADVITDFGSTPSSLTVALYQMSRQVGRGFAYKVTQPVGADVDFTPGVPTTMRHAATPTFSPASGTRFSTTQVVTIACATAGSAIHYTTNGSTPTTSSPTYTGPITLSTSATVKAIATASGYSQSGVGSSNYVLAASSPVMPDAPTIGVLSPLNGAASLAFTPNADGGSPVLDFTVTTTGGHTATGTGSPITVTSPNGIAITAHVTARNVAGISAASAQSNSATPVSGGTTFGWPTMTELVPATAASNPSNSNFYVPPAAGGVAFPKGKWGMIQWQANPNFSNGLDVVNGWAASAKTGFAPMSPLLAQRSYQNVAGSSTVQIEGIGFGAYMNSADLPGAPLNQKMMATPEFRWATGAEPLPFSSGSGAVLSGSIDLQIPTAIGNDVYSNIDLRFLAPGGDTVSYGVSLFHNHATSPAVSTAHDIPTGDYIIQSPLGIDTTYVGQAGSNNYQSASWIGYKTFAWSISYAQFVAAITHLNSVFGTTLSTDPTLYELLEIHLNAEFHFNIGGVTNSAEMGWSGKNFSVSMP